MTACGQPSVIKKQALVRAEAAKEQTIDCNGLALVTVEIPRGSITVRCEGARISASVASKRFAYGPGRSEATRRAEAIKLDVTVNGDNLLIKATLPSAPQDEALGVDLVLILPANLSFKLNCDQGDIELRGAVGNVSATSRIGGMDISEVTGDVTVSAKRGDVSLRDVSGTTRLRCGTGDTELYRIGNVESATRVGSVRLYHPQGTVSLRTDRGEVLVQAPKLATRPNVKIRTSKGAVRLEVPKTVECHLKLRAGKGLVTAFLDNVEIADRVSTYNSYVANLNGGGGKITVTTGEGAIHIEGVGRHKLVK